MPVARWKGYSVEQIKQFALESKSQSEFLSRMGYNRLSGSNTQTFKNILKAIPDLDTSHFLGQGWNKNNFNLEVFKNDNLIGNGKALNILKHLRGNRCENCGLEEWMNNPIPLEVHHIDGDHYNNDLTNLQLLCPNCHALTDNWRGRNISNRQTISDEQFVEALKSNRSIRQALLSLKLTASGANYERAYKLIEEHNLKLNKS